MPDKTGKKIKKILTYVHLAYPSYPSYQAYSHVFFFRIYFFLLDFLQIGDTLYDNEYREYMKKILLILTSCFALYFCNAAPPSSLLQNVCIIKGENGSGSGFFLPFRNQWYVVTNNHVLLELKNPMILDVDGKKIDFDGAYLSPDRDLAYIPFKNYSVRGTYLKIHSSLHSILPGSKVQALGNSFGHNVIVAADGKFYGAGPDLIDVDAGFVSGNSGGPVILSKTNQVIGVATFLQVLKSEITNIGSRFEFKKSKPAVRRFATRIDDIDPLQLERVTLQQILDDHAEFEKITKLENEIHSLCTAGINQTAIEKLKKYRYLIRHYRTTYQWNSTYLKKEYEKKYKFLYDSLKKIFPSDEFEFSASRQDRENKLAGIWKKYRRHVKIKKISGKFQFCGICRGHGNSGTYIENRNHNVDMDSPASETKCILCNGTGKIQLQPSRQYFMFTKNQIGELSSVIEKEKKKQICGYTIGDNVTSALFKNKKYSRRKWDFVYFSCFRIFRYPGNPDFPAAKESRFWFFGAKLMRVDLYFPIENENTALQTEQNFYKKYSTADDQKRILDHIRHGQVVTHGEISSGRVHIFRNLLTQLYQQLKEKETKARNSQVKPKNLSGQKQNFAALRDRGAIAASNYSKYFSSEFYHDPFGSFFDHNTRRCLCTDFDKETKQYLRLSLRHTDFDFIQDLFQKIDSGIEF
ncbi:MAG: trypsin-like peptidase domain-containing protein [Lentisphaeria bacterium]|nr:trypsin-like peptidase domain-containing protein [Lentisphaeria bacterium]